MLRNGRIQTMTGSEVVSAVAAKDGRVQAVGADVEVSRLADGRWAKMGKPGDGTRMYRLNGAGRDVHVVCRRLGGLPWSRAPRCAQCPAPALALNGGRVSHTSRIIAKNTTAEVRNTSLVAIIRLCASTVVLNWRSAASGCRPARPSAST